MYVLVAPVSAFIFMKASLWTGELLKGKVLKIMFLSDLKMERGFVSFQVVVCSSDVVAVCETLLLLLNRGLLVNFLEL